MCVCVCVFVPVCICVCVCVFVCVCVCVCVVLDRSGGLFALSGRLIVLLFPFPTPCYIVWWLLQPEWTPIYVYMYIYIYIYIYIQMCIIYIHIYISIYIWCTVYMYMHKFIFTHFQRDTPSETAVSLTVLATLWHRLDIVEFGRAAARRNAPKLQVEGRSHACREKKGLYYVSVATYIKGNPDEIPSVGELHSSSIGHFFYLQGCVGPARSGTAASARCAWPPRALIKFSSLELVLQRHYRWPSFSEVRTAKLSHDCRI